MDYSKFCINIFENSLSAKLCKNIIKRFEEDTNKVEGSVGYGDGKLALNHKLKKCTELNLSLLESWKDIDTILFNEIGNKIKLLRNKYKGLTYLDKVNDQGYRIKRYVNDGTEFFDWHIDQNGMAQSERYFIFMWYLNTVEEGGETEFRLQNISVKPVEGRLITFPPYWTHEHRALPPISGYKYVINSWITF